MLEKSNGSFTLTTAKIKDMSVKFSGLLSQYQYSQKDKLRIRLLTEELLFDINNSEEKIIRDREISFSF